MENMEFPVTQKDFGMYLSPLFWQRCEDETLLREEIRQMNKNGIDSFIVESRMHPDFCGEKWWHDLDIILDESKSRNMKFFLFDDSAFPSGYCAGRMRALHPEYMKIYLAERHMDAMGPLKGSAFRIQAWLEDAETLVSVVASPRIDGEDKLDAGLFLDLTSHITDGVLYWDVPDGAWRIFVVICTTKGGEEATRDHINPIDTDAVAAYIEMIHEAHFKRYAHEFGKTILGFFTDEPRFGNAATYEGALGNKNRVLPYSRDLMESLSMAWGGNFRHLLPCLWYDGGKLTASVRYTYMNVVSRLFGERFTGQISDWCKARHVKLIGHVIEDNGAHAGLGYGCGHFFRATAGLGWAGMDLVHQVWPGYTSGKLTSPLGYLDVDFFYWGIAKMASSSSHIDPGKDGVTACEAFGAYGWQAGLKLMKWLTDHLCVRGVNHLIPHAFSTKYPDPDCPPHFYARGMNPQWRYFHIWSGYANRVCHFLRNGRHVAPIAILYHAEAEWAGKFQPFEQIVKILSQNQIDCDVIPLDALLDETKTRIGDGIFGINQETYQALVIPYSEHLPLVSVNRLIALAEHHVPVFFCHDYPAGLVPSKTSIEDIYVQESLNRLKSSTNTRQCDSNDLPGILWSMNLFDIRISGLQEDLRYFHYVQPSGDVYFFTNESRRSIISTDVRFKQPRPPILYDAMKNEYETAEASLCKNSSETRLVLAPYESLFILFPAAGKVFIDSHRGKRKNHHADPVRIPLQTMWTVSLAEIGQYPVFKAAPDITTLGNINLHADHRAFSGTARYSASFVFKNSSERDLILLDLGELYEIADVWLNGLHVSEKISPPYRFDVTTQIQDGVNLLQIDVTNTLSPRLGDNWLDRSMPMEPSGLLGPVELVVEANEPTNEMSGILNR